MNYDKLVNRVLQEQYFGGSPYERSTGIKRQIETPINEDESEFRGTKNRKLGAMHLAVLRALDDWHDHGEPMGKAGADILIDRYLHHLLHEKEAGLIAGDEVTSDDHQRALLALGHATGVKGEELGAQLKYFLKKNFGPKTPEGETSDIDMKPPMSLTRMTNIGDEGEKKLRKLLGTMKPKDEVDIATGDDKIEAQRKLAAWKASRR